MIFKKDDLVKITYPSKETRTGKIVHVYEIGYSVSLHNGMSEQIPEAWLSQQCEGMRRHGGAFTLGNPQWHQCTNDAVAKVKIIQGEEPEAEFPACSICLDEMNEHRDIKILSIERFSNE